MRWLLVAVLLLAMVTLSCQALPAGDGGLPQKTPLPRIQPPGTSVTSPATPSAEDAIALAKKHLAQQLGIAEAEIELVSIREVPWPDTSLGVPEPGKVYAQVIVPGFRIVLSAKGEEYVYHTGKVGEKMVVIPAPPSEEKKEPR